MTMTQIDTKNRLKSADFYKRLCEVIPSGVGSPTRAFKYVAEDPLVVSHAHGDVIYDVDDNEYIDYHMSWGALIHGHAHPAVTEALQRRICAGTSYGLSCTLEDEMARLIVKHMPSIEQVRFVASGTEATMTALRVARGYTGREYIIKFTGNFHGHADFLLVQGGSAMVGITPTATSAGIPEDSIKYTICLPYNDIEAARQLLRSAEYRDKIAAVIVEPIAGNMGTVPATPEFLTMLREETTLCGAVLIFDEVINCFRVALGGAQFIYGISPDLTCLGKVVSGGTQAAAFGGKREIMQVLAPSGPVYQAGTLTGNPLAMEAGIQTIKLLEQPGIYELLEYKAQLMLGPVQELLKSKNAPACIQRVGSMFTFFFGRSSVCNMEEAQKCDDVLFKKFFSHLFQHGVLVAPAHYEASFISTVHSDEHLLYTRDVMMDFVNHVF